MIMGKRISGGAAALVAAGLMVAACNAESDASAAATGTDGKGAAAMKALAAAAPVAAAPVAGRPSPQDRAAIMRAAGFTDPQGDDRWTYGPDGCDGVWATIDQYRDINGDGRPDAVVGSDGDACFGMNQRKVILLTRSAAGWDVVTDFQMRFVVYGFFPRPGIAWPDIEMFDGMSGEQKPDGNIVAGGCEHFLRWNGREYVAGGTSQNGRICTTEKIAGASPVAAAPAPAGQSAFLPLPIGYYASRYGRPAAEACADESSLKYLGRDAIHYAGGEPCRHVSTRALGKGAYAVTTMCEGRSQTERFEVKGTSWSWGENGGDDGDLCPAASVPSALRFKG